MIQSDINDWNAEIVKRAMGQWRWVVSPWTKSAFLHASVGSVIVDLGCGFGRFLKWLLKEKEEPFSYLGVDSSEHMIDACVAEFRDVEEAIFLVRDVVESLTFLTKEGMSLLCNSVLIHLPFEHQEQVLRNIYEAEPVRAVFDIESNPEGSDAIEIRPEMGGRFYRTRNDPEKFERRILDLFRNYEIMRMAYPYGEGLRRHVFVALNKI